MQYCSFEENNIENEDLERIVLKGKSNENTVILPPILISCGAVA